MANVKITDLTAYTNPVSTDVLPIVDIGTDVTKKVSIADLLKNASAGTAAAPGIAFDGDNTGIYSPGADQVAISTNGTGRLFVDASGNVGVGTASPSDYNSGADDLVVFNSGNSGITIAAGNTSIGNIFFADGDSGVDRSRGFIKYFHSDNSLVFGTDGGEQARIDDSGRLGLGTSSPQADLAVAGNILAGTNITDGLVSAPNHLGTDVTAYVQVNSSGDDNPSISLNHARSNNLGSPCFLFNKAGGNLTTPTIVNSTTTLGTLVFNGYDGTNYINSALIEVDTDGTPGTDDMPGRLAFFVTADGSASPTEALRITNDRVRCYNQPAPTTESGAATLTVAELKTGIIEYTGSANTLTLPTGTLMEGGFSGIYTNMTFEWSVINTGSGTCTIGTDTGHTIVGAATVANGASGRFASRRTGANTFVTYRLA